MTQTHVGKHLQLVRESVIEEINFDLDELNSVEKRIEELRQEEKRLLRIESRRRSEIQAELGTSEAVGSLLYRKNRLESILEILGEGPTHWMSIEVLQQRNLETGLPTYALFHYEFDTFGMKAVINGNGRFVTGQLAPKKLLVLPHGFPPELVRQYHDLMELLDQPEFDSPLSEEMEGITVFFRSLLSDEDRDMILQVAQNSVFDYRDLDNPRRESAQIYLLTEVPSWDDPADMEDADYMIVAWCPAIPEKFFCVSRYEVGETLAEEDVTDYDDSTRERFTDGSL